VLFRFNNFESVGFEVTVMYTGRLIDDLIESVERAEKHARTQREQQMFESFFTPALASVPQSELLPAGAR
jgi:hypothetical protein